jgi:hypothetical protein
VKRLALAAAIAAAFPAAAVTLSTDGTGQALVYPYYTAQSSGGDAFNTYVSVVNHTAKAKALRVRFREGRAGREALSLNLFLSPNDVWTGAVVPFGEGTRLVSVDRSCTEPRLNVGTAPETPFLDFRNDAFSGADDDTNGTGLDRTREGFVEILEMATLTGASATAVTHDSAGLPANCNAIGSAPQVEAPSGGLSGTLTLINVANGMDFTVNAEALDALASRPYYRAASDAYPDFNAAEIDAVSVVAANGAVYRSVWTRPVDAVSAVLMRAAAMPEYTLDTPTASQTDLVMTLPTRHFYADAAAASAPFTAPLRWSPDCRAFEPLSVLYFNREEAGSGIVFDPPNRASPIGICAAAGVTSIFNGALATAPRRPIEATAVLGSTTRGLPGSTLGAFEIVPTSLFQGGWLRIAPAAFRGATLLNTLASGPSSTRLIAATGETVAGAHAFVGLPMVGFAVRTFRHGALRCAAGTCQGHYGGAFPFKYRRQIQPG